MGVASWYGPKFHGRRTASGEVFNMHQLTAAHRTLPLGTWVQVTHLENGRSIRVRINDRGPFVEGRIIDLSYAAARSLGMVKQGVAWVSVWPLQVPPSRLVGSPRTYTLQVGSFLAEKNAVTLKARLDAVISGAYIDKVSVDGQTFYRVRVGNFDSLEAARRVAMQVAGHGFTVVLIDQ
ncbi:MAG: septal ring lytic transglycosylase RlpA family protein [Candidatus Methylomirabilales bacterium]